MGLPLLKVLHRLIKRIKDISPAAETAKIITWIGLTDLFMSLAKDKLLLERQTK